MSDDYMEPIRLDFPIPEMGARVGDWLVLDGEDGMARVVREVPIHRVRAHLSRMTRVNEMVTGEVGKRKEVVK